MHKYKLYTHGRNAYDIDAEKVFVEEGALHIVHGKDEALTIFPANKWNRIEWVEEVKTNARKRSTKNPTP